MPGGTGDGKGCALSWRCSGNCPKGATPKWQPTMGSRLTGKRQKGTASRTCTARATQNTWGKQSTHRGRNAAVCPITRERRATCGLAGGGGGRGRRGRRPFCHVGVNETPQQPAWHNVCVDRCLEWVSRKEAHNSGGLEKTSPTTPTTPTTSTVAALCLGKTCWGCRRVFPPQPQQPQQRPCGGM